MSLFSFANISFGSKDRKFDSSTKLSPDYGYDIYRYPIDLGSMDKGHYMMFHINTQRRSLMQRNLVNGAQPTVIENRVKYNIATPATVLKDYIGADKALNFTRTIQRVTDTVALYMPDTVQFTNQQSYSEPGLTGTLAAGGSVLSQGSSIVDAFKNMNANGINKKDLSALAGNFSPMMANFLKDLSPLLSAGFTAYTGLVINPMLEMIYSSPSFREFRFDFMFYPRSEKEAVEVQKIINRFQYHQAPEILPEGDGFFLIPPSEFDILFYYNGSINPNIPKISTCVLQSIDVDYAPNGFSAYEVQGQTSATPGGTGTPVGIRMSLQFKETEIMTKLNFGGKTRATDMTEFTPETGVAGRARAVGGAGGFVPNNPVVNPSNLNPIGSDGTGIAGIDVSNTPIIIAP